MLLDQEAYNYYGAAPPTCVAMHIHLLAAIYRLRHRCYPLSNISLCGRSVVRSLQPLRDQPKICKYGRIWLKIHLPRLIECDYRAHTLFLHNEAIVSIACKTIKRVPAAIASRHGPGAATLSTDYLRSLSRRMAFCRSSSSAREPHARTMSPREQAHGR